GLGHRRRRDRRSLPARTDPQEVRHWIEVIDRLSHDGDHYAPGDAILLTSAQFDVLVKAGAVGGDWADGEAETEV
ncbi:hypothetical protein, partial [Streptomyces sp. P17]|uniref:hypothetical protein n=1 Tax=Streptomyces sp. P17 TaxID=3074716 RepID=UPI0028F3E6F7